MKDILVTICGVQNGDKEDAIKLVMPGTYRCENGITYISYKETEATGMLGTTTTIAVEGRRVSLIRKGTSNSVLILERGKRHDCDYQTPYGSMPIGVTASEVKADVSEDKGTIKAKYLISIGNEPSGENVFEITYRAV